MELASLFRRNANLCAVAALFAEAMVFTKQDILQNDFVCYGIAALAILPAYFAVQRMFKIDAERQKEITDRIDSIGQPQP